VKSRRAKPNKFTRQVKTIKAKLVDQMSQVKDVDQTSQNKVKSQNEYMHYISEKQTSQR